jgi:hypothetical protein
MSLYTDEDRPTGFLSKSDRRYLKDPEGYVEDHTRQTGNNRRRAVKQRLAHTFADLRFLTQVDDELRDDLLEGAAEELESFERERMENLDMMRRLPELTDSEEWMHTSGKSHVSAVSLLYEFFEDYADVGFADLVGVAVTEAHLRKGDPTTDLTYTPAAVDIDAPEKVDTKRVDEKIEKGELFDLDKQELLYALYALSPAGSDVGEGEVGGEGGVPRRLGEEAMSILSLVTRSSGADIDVGGAGRTVSDFHDTLAPAKEDKGERNDG